MLQLHMIPTSGDSTLLRFLEKDTEISILVDGGNRRDKCLSYLKSHRVKRLHFMIASHLDEDHIRGLRLVADEMPIDELWVTDFSPFIAPAVDSIYMTKCFYEASLLVDGRGIREGNKLAVYDGFKRQIGPLFLEVLSAPIGLRNYLRKPNVIEQILRSAKGHTIRRYVQEALEKELRYNDNVRDRERSEKIVHRVLERFKIEVPQIQEIDKLIENEDTNWFEKDKFFESARSLFNDISIVVKITYDYHSIRQTFLFPGDLANWSIVLSTHPQQIRGHMMKVPHHGSEIYANRDEILSCWLAETAHPGIWGRLPPPWHHLWEEWHILLKEYGLPPGPWFSQLGPVPPMMLSSLDSAGLYEYLSPTHSLIYPYESSFRLPRLDVRNAIKSNSRQVSCNFKEGRATAKVMEPGDSCIDCYNCKERTKPTIFKWSA